MSTMILTDAPPWRFLVNRNDAYVGRSLVEYGEWSQGEIDLLAPWLRPGDTVVELGANIGAHTVHLARLVGPEGRVHAFEPRRIYFQMLCANLMLNDVFNVHAHCRAAGARSVQLREGAIDLRSAQNFGALRFGAFAGADEAIDLVPLDAHLDALGTVRLLKADIEGGEAAMLEGAAELIRRDRPILYLEADPHGREALFARLLGLGYSVFWHIVDLYRPDNLKGAPGNVFPGLASFNVVALPPDFAGPHPALRRVATPVDEPFGP
jgi:FkbM family methyltransferase